MPPLRPLLPSVQGHRRDPPISLPPKKRNATLACEGCRRKKTRCDNIRPTCGACTKRASACYYSETETRQIRNRYNELRQRGSAYEELIELLQTVSEQDAIEVVRRLKAGRDVASVVSHVKNGNLLMQLSLTPETTRRYEFPYVSAMPGHLFTANNPYVDSLLYQGLFPPLSSPSDGSEVNGKTQNSNRGQLSYQGQHAGEDARQRATPAGMHYSAYMLPYRTAQMIEPVIDRITAAPWTRVISDNRLFKRLISSYFCFPHPCGPFVHKDLFLEDMAAGRTSFCSPLLVNAMLANASQSCLDVPDRAKVWLPQSLTYRFTAEARRLWDMESLPGRSKITTIQAALILSYNTTNNGLDEVETVYAKRACEMCEDLDLFGPTTHERGIAIDKARVFTAWAVFSWQTMFDYYFFRRPYFNRYPQVPLPDPQSESSWYGEIRIQYPHDPTIFSLHLGQQLFAEAELRKIMHDMALLAFVKPEPELITLDEFTAIKRKLDLWRDSLPEPLQPRAVVFPSHLMLHVQYWQVVKSFVQLLMNANYLSDLEASDLCAGEQPSSVFHEARVMLETVTCLYYARHSFETYDPWIAFALTIIGNAVITDLKTDSIFEPHTLDGYRALLILSAQGLASQSLNYHNGTLLAMQLQGAVDAVNLQLVRTYATTAFITKTDQWMIAEYSQNHWPLPGMVAINEDPERARLNGLIEAFEETQVSASNPPRQ